MGMYTTYIEEDIEVLNYNALIKFKEESTNKGAREWYVNSIINDEGEVSFMEWDEIKLYKYWYTEQQKVLSEIAKHIKGYVEFRYEEGNYFRIVFKDKKWFLQESKVVFKKEMYEFTEKDRK